MVDSLDNEFPILHLSHSLGIVAITFQNYSWRTCGYHLAPTGTGVAWSIGGYPLAMRHLSRSDIPWTGAEVGVDVGIDVVAFS